MKANINNETTDCVFAQEEGERLMSPAPGMSQFC